MIKNSYIKKSTWNTKAYSYPQNKKQLKNSPIKKVKSIS